MNTHKITTGHWRPTLEGEDLHTETREYVLLKDVEAALRRIQGMCGAPDAADGCRTIIKYIDELLEGK